MWVRVYEADNCHKGRQGQQSVASPATQATAKEGLPAWGFVEKEENAQASLLSARGHGQYDGCMHVGRVG